MSSQLLPLLLLPLLLLASIIHAELHAEEEDGPTYNYKTKTGIYCQVGMGMRTGIGISPNIDMYIGREQYCVGVSAEDGGNGCFEASTDNIQFMRDLFGDNLGDTEWDSYYDDFYVKGCRGVHYGTNLKSSGSADCTEEGDNTKWKLRTDHSVQVVIERNETINMEELTPAEKSVVENYLSFNLEFCCREQHCESGAERLGVRGVATGTMMMMVVGVVAAAML